MRWVKSENRLVTYYIPPRLPHILIHVQAATRSNPPSEQGLAMLICSFIQTGIHMHRFYTIIVVEEHCYNNEFLYKVEVS